MKSQNAAVSAEATMSTLVVFKVTQEFSEFLYRMTSS
jgi:hypothetical protein